MGIIKRSLNFSCASLVLCALALGATETHAAEASQDPPVQKTTKSDALIATATTTFITTLIVVPAAIGLSFGADAFLGNIGGVQFYFGTLALVPVLIATASALSASWYTPTLAAWGVAFATGTSATFAYLLSSFLVRTDNSFFRTSAAFIGPALVTASTASLAMLVMPLRQPLPEE